LFEELFCREVHHVKFHGWPDCGVPEFPAPFLALLERVPKDLKSPIVTHCSAGLGKGYKLRLEIL
jgi:receptor-type tyrosine-protein phosphatase S